MNVVGDKVCGNRLTGHSASLQPFENREFAAVGPAIETFGSRKQSLAAAGF